MRELKTYPAALCRRPSGLATCSTPCRTSPPRSAPDRYRRAEASTALTAAGMARPRGVAWSRRQRHRGRLTRRARLPGRRAEGEDTLRGIALADVLGVDPRWRPVALSVSVARCRHPPAMWPASTHLVPLRAVTAHRNRAAHLIDPGPRLIGPTTSDRHSSDVAPGTRAALPSRTAPPTPAPTQSCRDPRAPPREFDVAEDHVCIVRTSERRDAHRERHTEAQEHGKSTP